MATPWATLAGCSVSPLRSTSSSQAFKSGDFGFLGEVDFDRIVYWRVPLRRQHVPIKTNNMPYVEIVPIYGGADGYLVKAALDHGAKGIVVQGLGWGNVNLPMSMAGKVAARPWCRVGP